MAEIHLPPDWDLSEKDVTPEHVYWDRRRLLKAAGFAGLGLLAGCVARGREESADPPVQRPWAVPPAPKGIYPAHRNPRYADAGRSLTPEETAASYNNFYEFSTDKARVRDLVGDFVTRPWTIRVDGLCANPRTWDVDDIERLGLEERIYRFRCVEAWSMVVPWTGIPLRRILERAAPHSKATHVRFVSFLRPKQAPGQEEQTWYPWPYYEALRIEEAMHELALLVTGIYGHRLPKQHGAPARVIVPWKYGYKSPKSIVRIELVSEQPGTFWNDLQPAEYGFLSNVDPEVPHPRWSQATERRISTGERIPTLPYNGYAEQVAGLYQSG